MKGALHLALVVALLVSSGCTAAPAAGRESFASPLSARVWVTTPDRTEQLTERPSVPFGTESSTQPTIVVDAERTYQSVDGFGASITDSSASVLQKLAPTVRADTLRRLFDPAGGIGVSFLRQPIGSSDFTAAAQHYTYDDVPAGQTDFSLSRFDIAHDRAAILPLLREAKRLNPSLKIMATPWSPPAWMKTTDSLIGGRLKDDPVIYDAYARYLVEFVRAYAAAGVPVDFLSVQNEPQNRKPSGYPGTDMPAAQQVRVIEALGPKLSAASPRTRILAYDHNWAVHPDDVASTPPGTSPETDYPYAVMRSPAARWIAGVAFHCYYGDPSAQSSFHDQFPDKGIWFTECSGSRGDGDAPGKAFRDTLTWHARNITIGTMRNWSRSALTWNIALDSTGGPHNGGCDTCSGLVTLQPDGTVTTDAEYYTIGHLSKFVRPGAQRIASTSFGTTGWNGQIMDVAFRNPDGSTALIVHNENDALRSFAVKAGERTFEYSLPGGALATFVWPKDKAAESMPKLMPMTFATATGVPAGGSAFAAIDDDASTRWTTGQAQQPGQSLTVDFSRPETFRRLALDSGGNLGDYARGYEVATSDNGSDWHTVASGSGTGQLAVVDVSPTRARYLRITGTTSSGNWWSVADIALYR